MRQYAILRNVVRDVNFGVVVKSAGNLKFFGWSERAVEWANWANQNGADLTQLPPNISVGEFRGMSDETMKSIILSSEEATAAGSSTITTKTLAFNLGREFNPNLSKSPSFVDSPIPGDWVSKAKSINFKAHNFRKEVAQNEIALKMRMHELAFDNNTKQFVAKPNRLTATHTRSEIQKKMSRGAERKFGKQIVEYTNKEILKNYVTPTIKRDLMGKSTKDILDVYTKARLGRAIGRAVGGAVRGATPNRRTRGVASRFISGVLDPRKRRDVDGDGMIFDGTWREMPDPNRFVQKPGRMNLPGGGGIGIRSNDPRENAELERSLRVDEDMRRRVSDGIAEIMNELRDAGLTPERPKRGKRERRVSDGDLLRSAGVPNEAPRAAAAVQMAFDTRNSRKASKMTYDPQTNSVEVTYNDGRMRRFDDVSYEDAKRAGANDAIDKLITDMETGRIGKESKEPIMGLRSSGGRRRRFDADDDPYGDDGYDEARDAYDTGDGPPVSSRQVREREADIENERGLRSSGDGGFIPINFNLPQVGDIPGVKKDKNGKYDLSDVDFESLTDDQLKALLQLFPQRADRPWDRNRGASEFENILSGKKSPRDSIISELKKRGYKVELGPERKPQFYGDYAAGDRYWNVRKPDAASSARARKGQATLARRRRNGDLMLRGEGAERLRSRGMTTREMMRGQPRPKLARLTPQSQSRVDNAREMLDSGRVDNLRQLQTQIDGLDYRISSNQNYLESLRDTLRRLGPSDGRRAETEKEFARVEQEIGIDSAIRDLTKKRYDRINKPQQNFGLRSSGSEGEEVRPRRFGVDPDARAPFQRESEIQRSLGLSLEEWMESPEGRRALSRLAPKVRSGKEGERREDFGQTLTGFKYPSKAQRKRIFDSKEDVDEFEKDMIDDYNRRRRQIEQELGFDDGYYMDDEELIQKFMDDYGMSKGEARQEMRKYRRNYDLLEKEQEIHERRLDELKEEKNRLPYQQELDDPIELDTNGFPKREDQKERFDELMQEGNPVFKARKKPSSRKKSEADDKRDPEIEDLIANFASLAASPSDESKRSLRSSGGSQALKDKPKQTSITELVNDTYDSMTQGGSDMDTGMRVVAETIGLNEKQTEKLAKIAYTLDRQGAELPRDASSQQQFVDAMMEERFGNQPLSDDQRASIREALSAFVAKASENRRDGAEGGAQRRTDEVSDIPTLIRRLQSGEYLTSEELDTLDELKDVVRGKRDVSEAELDAMMDLENEINSARRRVPQRRQFEPTQQALSSRGASRTPTPFSSRRSMATTERAAKPRGTTLRSSGGDGDAKPRKPAPKSGAGRGVGAGPGGKAGHARMERVYGRDKKGDDGKVFDSLTPEQQDAVKKALAEEVKPELDKKLKGFFSKYWKARTERGSKKQSLLAVRRRAKGDSRGRYAKVAEDTPLESADIYEMLYRLDGQVAEGLLEKFEVADKDSRDLKLTEDGQAKVSTARNGYTVQQRALDDAQTILNMIENNDFSALEHLHPSTKKKVADIIKKNGGVVPKGWIDSESSVAGWAGGEGRTKAPDAIDLEKERGISTKKAEKRLSLFQRLRRVDPERERRVELRAARRQGRIREGIALDPDLELKRRVLRGRAMKRTFMSRFRKNRDPEVLATDMKSRKDETSVLRTNPADGSVEVTDGYVDLLHALDQGLIGINEKKKRGKLSEDELESEHKTLLRRLWENSGYSETPVQLKEDEVKALLDAGWQVMIRGTGGEKVNSESYVEQFITSEGRFIPGQGGSAYGIGEYFAFPGEWGGYHGHGDSDRHTIVALIPPTADVMMRSEIEREHRNLGNITTRISDAFKVFGGRDAVKAMEPEELAAEIDKAVPDLASDKSRTGQIVRQLRDRLEALSKLPRNDDAQRAVVQEQKEKVLNSLDYLQRFAKQRQAEMIAPLIGVDVIDTNNGDGTGSPMLLHNRTNLAVFQVPITHKQAIDMTSDSNGARRPKVWTSWKRKAAEISERAAPKRRRTRRSTAAQQATPPAPTPSAPNPPATPSAPNPPVPDGKGAKAPVDVSSWTSSRPQSTGSNPATLLTAPDGTQYYTKLPKGTPDDKDRMETEALASELYKLAGIQSADVQMGTRNGQPVTLSRMVQSRMPNSQADQDEALKGYVVDAWLANWDAPLNDNIKIDSNGNAIRLDVGGSLDFRAQGARKGQAWGNTVGEIDSMKKSGTYDYKKITDAAIKQQAKALGNVTDADIRATVSRIVSDPARAKALADTLIARRDDIVKRYA